MNDVQHCFDIDYRNAHNSNFIERATTQELSVVVKELSKEFYKTAVKAIEDEVDNPLRRYCLFSEFLVDALNNLTEKNESLLLQTSICLGSLLEGTLQIFLLAYKNDYIDSHWKQWQETDIDKIKNDLNEFLKGMVNNKLITSHQKSSIWDAICTELIIRENGKTVPRIMLDELIGFFKCESVFNESDQSIYTYMEDVRDNRNNIHVFTNKPLPEYSNVIENVRQYCMLLKDFIDRMNF